MPVNDDVSVEPLGYFLGSLLTLDGERVEFFADPGALVIRVTVAGRVMCLSGSDAGMFRGLLVLGEKRLGVVVR